MGVNSMWNALTSAGITNAGAAAVLGNLKAESGLVSNAVQLGFSNGMSNKAFTELVDTSGWPLWFNGGYGLAQWTYSPRRKNLLDYARLKGCSIGDEVMQIEFVLIELQNEYPTLLSFLKSTDSIYEATERVCKEYERPAVNNVDIRFSFSCSIFENHESPEMASTSSSATTDTLVYPGLPMLKKGSKGPAVGTLQTILNYRGAELVVDEDFGRNTHDALVLQQDELGIDADGWCGKITWAALVNGG